MKQIIDIRIIEYVWHELDTNAAPGAINSIAMIAHRMEVRLEGETEWREIPVIRVNEKPKNIQ